LRSAARGASYLLIACAQTLSIDAGAAAEVWADKAAATAKIKIAILLAAAHVKSLLLNPVINFHVP
jgi:hypothetical protein